MNKFTTWENERLNNYVQTRVGTGASTNHSTNTPQFRQVSYFWLILWDFQSHCVFGLGAGWPTGRAVSIISSGVGLYWQSAFPEHIDSPNREWQPSDLLKAIVCFLGLAKHLVHVTQPSKTKLQSDSEEKLSPTSPSYNEPLISHSGHFLGCSLDT